MEKMTISGRTYPVSGYFHSAPILDIPMMSDARWDELSRKNAVENYIQAFGREPESVETALEWQQARADQLTSSPITFPVSVDDLAAYQEKLMPRPMADTERELLAELVPALNDSFRDGQNGDSATLWASINYLSRLEQKSSGAAAKFWRAVQVWTLRAWEQGTATR